MIANRSCFCHSCKDRNLVPRYECLFLIFMANEQTMSINDSRLNTHFWIVNFELLIIWWCPGRDLNSYTVRQRLLRPSCLPIPPPGRVIMSLKILSCTPLVSLGGMAPNTSLRFVWIAHLPIPPPGHKRVIRKPLSVIRNEIWIPIWYLLTASC